MPVIMEEYLKALISTGNYGATDSDALQTLSHDAIERLIAERRLKRRPSEDPL